MAADSISHAEPRSTSHTTERSQKGKKLLPETSPHTVSPPSPAAAWSRPPSGRGKASELLWPSPRGCGHLRRGAGSVEERRRNVRNPHLIYSPERVERLAYTLALPSSEENATYVRFNSYELWPLGCAHSAVQIGLCVSVCTDITATFSRWK